MGELSLFPFSDQTLWRDRNAARALTLGPLGYDVDLAHKSLVGFGTNEMLLTELILGRPGHEIRWLKTAYKLRYGKDLVDAVKSDLSGSIERSQHHVFLYGESATEFLALQCLSWL